MSEDLRVPTFIPYETEAPASGKTVTKRKRTAKKENKPNKKKKAVKATKRSDLASELSDQGANEEEPAIKQIWVGAIIDKDRGVFSVYFGQGDARNCAEVFNKENELQDLDYASALGAKRAVEITEHVEEPLIVNTSCRVLPRAITGRVGLSYYSGVATQIRDMINRKGHKLQVRYVSGRTASEGQKAAMDLATEALRSSEHSSNMQTDNVDVLSQQIAQDAIAASSEEQVTRDMIATPSDQVSVALETNDKKVLNETIEAVIAESTKTHREAVMETCNSINDKEVLNEINGKLTEATEAHQKAVIDAYNSVDGDTVMVQTMTEIKVVETKSETKNKLETKDKAREINDEEPEETLCIDSDQSAIEETKQGESIKEVPTAPTSWASAFSIKGLFDVLSSPFRSRTSS